MREVISNRLATISIRDLSLVEAVAHYRGFRPAAKFMGISASGLSYQIRKVEEAIGFNIFERGREVSLTEEGQHAIDTIKKILSIMASIDRARTELGRVLGPLIRLGTISSLAPSDMLLIIKQFEKHSPHTEIEIISGKHNGLLRRLIDREIDVLISAELSIPAGYETSPLYDEGFVWLSKTDGELTYFPSNSDDFAPAECTTDHRWVQSRRLRQTYGLGLEQRISLVTAGYGSTIAPENWLRNANLPNVISITPAKGTRRMRAIWRQSYALKEELVKILEEFWERK